MAPSQILLPRRPLAIAGTLTALSLSAWAAKSLLIRNVHAESPSKAPPDVFSGFPGPRLRLEGSEMVNHNTKRLRFAFPDSEARSGLALTCKIFLG